MSQFIDSLESRTLLSAAPLTKTEVLADEMAIISDSATTRADLKSASVVMAADTRTVAADVKTLNTPANRQANAALLKTLRSDNQKYLATLRKDEAGLLGPGGGLARRASAHALALIQHPTNTKLQAQVTADMTALSTANAAALAKLQADVQTSTFSTDLNNIVTANPSSTLLATHVQSAETDATTATNTFNTAAAKFQTDTGTLSTDLSGAPTGGSTGNFPNLVHTYNGNATSTSGNHVGRVSTLVIQITSEGTDGSVTGTATITNPGQSPQTQNLTGSVTTGGAFSATATDPTNSSNGATISGTVSGTKISGTFSSTDGTDAGTFSVTQG